MISLTGLPCCSDTILPLTRCFTKSNTNELCLAAGFLGQMGPTADGVNSQAESTAQALKTQAAPAAEAVKSQAQSVAPSSAEPVSQGLQPSASSGNIVDSAKAAGEQLQNQLKSSSDVVLSKGNVRYHAFAACMILCHAHSCCHHCNCSCCCCCGGCCCCYCHGCCC